MTTSSKEAEALSATIDLSPFILKGHGSSTILKRMTSPGLDSTDSDTVTWAGQSYTNGLPSGKEIVETVTRGIVTVAASEGVLVFF